MKRRILLASLMLILIAALTRGFFYLRYSIRRAREATLKADLFVIRKAIIDYTLEKNKTPQSMQDLMNEHYLKEIPTDPFTRKKDWVPITSDILLSPYQTDAGISTVHSASDEVGSDGSAYNTW